MKIQMGIMAMRKLDFYKKYGFASVGDHFIEAEREHVTMVHEPLNDIYDK